MCKYCNQQTTSLVTVTGSSFLACEEKYTEIPVCDKCAALLAEHVLADIKPDA
jgi:hypothetical protein